MISKIMYINQCDEEHVIRNKKCENNPHQLKESIDNTYFKNMQWNEFRDLKIQNIKKKRKEKANMSYFDISRTYQNIVSERSKSRNRYWRDEVIDKMNQNIDKIKLKKRKDDDVILKQINSDFKLPSIKSFEFLLSAR